MTYEIHLSKQGNALLKALVEGLEKKQLFRSIFLLFEKLSLRAAAYVVKHKLSGQVLRRRTAALAQSMTGRAIYQANGLPGFRVGVFRGPALKYAGVLEHGTQGENPASPYPTIVPVRSRYLAMPVGDALTPAGVAKWKSPRDFPGRLVFIPFRSSGIAAGALYDAESLARARGRGGTMNWAAARKLWVLLKKLDLPARYYMLEGMREFLPQVAGEMVAFLKDMVANAGLKPLKA